MLQQSFLYTQDAVKLQIEGLPDYSIDQSSDKIGIISVWKLQIAGFPELEGNKEHLQAFINVLFNYSKYYLSGYRGQITENSNIVKVKPHLEGHQITLTSTKKDIMPLDIIIDDAELTDLICCIDKLRSDNRINIDWINNADNYISNKYILNKAILIKKLLPLSLGITSFILLSIILLPTTVEEIRQENKIEFNKRMDKI